MKKYSIAILVPTTSNGRNNWHTIEHTYIYNILLKTLYKTLDQEHKYTIYVGIDPDDRIFSNPTEIIKLKNIFKHIEFKFIKFQNIEKGYLTKMWNILFTQAYNDSHDYFFQCGDDIHFYTKGWVNACVNALLKNNNIGISGPMTQNLSILTQVMVSRKHMDIFGYFFPTEMKNWFCDNWYCHTYKPNHYFPLLQHHCINQGGIERYNIGNIHQIRLLAKNIAERDKNKLENYLKNNIII